MSILGRDQETLTKMPSVELVRLLRGMGETFVEPWKSALGWLSDDAVASADVLMSWNNIGPWDNQGGRVTLAGDAAHAMTPCEKFSVLVLSIFANLI